ncbi:MAG: tetratricopeptide repeat protein [Proteobacteria bacterium]|nr:tetratricopeptide repeat protein [Pseudomonadota bacterium]
MASTTETQQPAKRKRRWLRVVIILLVILAIVGTVAIFNRGAVSRLTHGILFGPSLETLPEDILLSDGAKPAVTEAQRAAFKAYSRDVYREQYRKLDDQKREVVDELRAANRLAALANAGKIKLTPENAEAEFKKALDEIKENSDSGFLSSLIPSAWAADLMDDAQAIEAVTLHNMAVGMMLDGHYDLSLVLASLSAAENTQNASTATLIANLLRQSDNDYDALEMLKFALQQEPNNEAILISLGMLYLDLNKIPKARQAFNKALQLSGGGGPANQGMMLVSFAEGDLGSAYLYMLEGAKEGYTSVITQAYNRFIKLAGGYNQYIKFAGPILKQYGYEHLTDFKRTRLAFDPTLDTVGQQIMADRTMHLPTTAPQVISSAGISLSAALDHLAFLVKTMFSDIDLNDVVQGDSINFDKLFESESFNNLLKSHGIDGKRLSKNLNNLKNNVDDEGNINVIGLLTGLMGDSETGVSAEKVTYGEQNYEQEEFWLNILYDYTFYNYTNLTEQYYLKPADKYFVGAIEKSMDDLTKRTDAFSKQFDNNPIGGVVAMLSNLIDNGSPLADRKYTEDQVNKMSERFCPFNPIMAEGYKESIMLAEHYWLVTNNILGLIADDKVYNRHHDRRNVLAVSVLSYFPMAAGVTNAMIGLLSNVWGGLTYSGHMNNVEFKTSLEKYVTESNATAKYPKITELPITGMGKDPKPRLVVRIDVPRPKDVVATAQKVYKKNKKTEDEQPGTQDNAQANQNEEQAPKDDGAELNIVLRPGHEEMAEVFATDSNPHADDDDDDDEPESVTTVEGIHEAPVKPGIKVKLSKLFSLQQDATTGKTELGVSWILGGIKGGFDPQSGDLYLYGQLGLSAAADLEAGAVNIQGAGVTAGFFLKGTVNVYDMSVESSDVGAELDYHLGSTSVSTAVSYDPVFGVKRDTAAYLINGEGQRITTETEQDLPSIK